LKPRPESGPDCRICATRPESGPDCLMCAIFRCMAFLGSEEEDVAIALKGSGDYTIVFDPLDGPPGFRVQGAMVQGAGCRAQGAGCRVQGFGSRVQGSGFWVESPNPETQG